MGTLSPLASRCRKRNKFLVWLIYLFSSPSLSEHCNEMKDVDSHGFKFSFSFWHLKSWGGSWQWKKISCIWGFSSYQEPTNIPPFTTNTQVKPQLAVFMSTANSSILWLCGKKKLTCFHKEKTWGLKTKISYGLLAEKRKSHIDFLVIRPAPFWGRFPG